MGTPLLMGTGSFGPTAGPYISPLILTWYNSLSVKPSSGLLTNINNLVDGINSDGDWALLDLFHTIGGLETNEQRLRPLLSTSGADFTAINSPALDVNGVTGNGTSSYLNLNWIPSTNGINYTQNNASFGVYNRTSGNPNGKIDIGSNDGTNFTKIILTNFGGSYNFTINSSNAIDSGAGSPLALNSALRTGASANMYWIRGAAQVSFTRASLGISTKTFYLGALNGNGVASGFTTRNYSLVFCGSGSINQLNFYNRIQTYMTAVGINV